MTLLRGDNQVRSPLARYRRVVNDVIQTMADFGSRRSRGVVTPVLRGLSNGECDGGRRMADVSSGSGLLCVRFDATVDVDPSAERLVRVAVADGGVNGVVVFRHGRQNSPSKATGLYERFVAGLLVPHRRAGTRPERSVRRCDLAGVVLVGRHGARLRAESRSGRVERIRFPSFLSIRREFVGRPEEVKRPFVDSAISLGRDQHFRGRGLVDRMRAIQSVWTLGAERRRT